MYLGTKAETHNFRITGSSPIICLMIGSTIDKLCKGGNDLNTDVTTSADNVSFINGSLVTYAPETSNHFSCEVSVATSVTFLTGIIQVSY